MLTVTHVFYLGILLEISSYVTAAINHSHSNHGHNIADITDVLFCVLIGLLDFQYMYNIVHIMVGF